MKPRHGARVDEVQSAIVAALRDAGAQVLVLDVSEAGAPDILVAWLGALTLLELKSPGGRLSDDQKAWHERWARAGVRVHQAKTPREALAAIGLSPEAITERQAAMRSMLTERRRESVARAKGDLVPSVRRYRATEEET